VELTANPPLHPTRYSGLRPLSRAGELQRLGVTRSQMKWYLLLVTGLLGLLSGFHVRADGFAFEVTDPTIRITIPDIPQIKMGVHPQHAEQPHLRFFGSEGAITVSILTPTADQGMTAIECAQSTAREIIDQNRLDPSNVFRGRVNDHTFAVLYAKLADGFVHLHAHFLSAAYGTHCVHVHVSKVSKSKDDLGPWFKGFTRVDIVTDSAQPGAPGDAPKPARP
jgi:hypothetical protein